MDNKELEECVGQVMILTDDHNNVGYFFMDYIKDDLPFCRVGIRKLEHEKEKIQIAPAINEVLLPYEKFFELKNSFITFEAFKLLTQLRNDD